MLYLGCCCVLFVVNCVVFVVFFFPIVRISLNGSDYMVCERRGFLLCKKRAWMLWFILIMQRVF